MNHLLEQTLLRMKLHLPIGLPLGTVANDRLNPSAVLPLPRGNLRRRQPRQTTEQPALPLPRPPHNANIESIAGKSAPQLG